MAVVAPAAEATRGGIWDSNCVQTVPERESELLCLAWASCGFLFFCFLQFNFLFTVSVGGWGGQLILGQYYKGWWSSLLSIRIPSLLCMDKEKYTKCILGGRQANMWQWIRSGKLTCSRKRLSCLVDTTCANNVCYYKILATAVVAISATLSLYSKPPISSDSGQS